MLVQIVSGTPAWVWFLLAGLIVLGVSHTRARRVPPSRLAALPAVMAVLSLAGTVSAVGASVPVLVGWALGGAVVLGLVGRLPVPAGVRRDPSTGRFAVPGSWAPLALMMAIFAVRYAVGASLAIVPRLAHDSVFVLAVAVVYGSLAGIFAGRSVRLLRALPAPRGVHERSEAPVATTAYTP